jgi:hypothetical protein
MIPHDVRQTNRAVRQLIEKTTDTRHRHLLLAFDRHRNLEMAGRYEELLAPDMMVDHPTYRLLASGIDVTLEGKESVKSLYRMWAATNQSVFYTEDEEVAVADNFVTSVATAYHQVSGRSHRLNWMLAYLPTSVARRVVRRSLRARHFRPNKTMYLYKNTYYMIWRYDKRGRLLGEDIWEPAPHKAQVTKLARSDVLTTQEAARLLAPLIEPPRAAAR